MFYKGSFNLFLLSPVGDPRSFIPFFLLSFPFVLNYFSPLSVSVSSPLFCFFLSLSFLPSVEVSVLIMMLWGFGMVELFFSPPPFSFFFLSLALIPQPLNMSGKRQTLNGGKWEETDAGLLMMVFIYTMIDINVFSKLISVFRW